MEGRGRGFCSVKCRNLPCYTEPNWRCDILSKRIFFTLLKEEKRGKCKWHKQSAWRGKAWRSWPFSSYYLLLACLLGCVSGSSDEKKNKKVSRIELNGPNLPLHLPCFLSFFSFLLLLIDPLSLFSFFFFYLFLNWTEIPFFFFLSSFLYKQIYFFHKNLSSPSRLLNPQSLVYNLCLWPHSQIITIFRAPPTLPGRSKSSRMELQTATDLCRISSIVLLKCTEPLLDQHPT